jgi:peptidoglycan/LPS O-acetylase OafA/YrhL
MVQELRQKLSRVSNQHFIPEIDGLRFLAIFLVILLHAKTTVFKEFDGAFNKKELLQNPLFYIIYHGDLGVKIFFSISGFILAMPFSKAGRDHQPFPSLKNFYLRRLTRLEPPFFLVMIGLFVVTGIQSHQLNWDYFKHFLASISYSHLFIYGQWSPINPVTWSLETEVQFYLLLPLFAYAFRISNQTYRWLVVLLFTILLSILARNIDLYAMNLQKSLLRYWGFFAVGMLFADFYQNQNGWIKGKKSFLFDVIGLICFSFLLGNYPITLDNFWFKNIHSFNYIWVFPFFLSVFRGKILSWIFTLPWIVIFGGMCYTIYLIHYPILFLLGGKVLPFLPKANPVGFWEVYIPFLLISFVVLALFSAVFFVIFEKPFMYKDWPEKWQAAIKSRFRKSNT